MGGGGGSCAGVDGVQRRGAACVEGRGRGWRGGEVGGVVRHQGPAREVWFGRSSRLPVPGQQRAWAGARLQAPGRRVEKKLQSCLGCGPREGEGPGSHWCPLLGFQGPLGLKSQVTWQESNFGGRAVEPGWVGPGSPWKGSGLVAVGSLTLGQKGSDVSVGTVCGLPTGGAFPGQGRDGVRAG